MASTYGPVYEEKVDGERVRRQMDRVRSLMVDGHWRTLREIAAATDDPESSVSAQLRHLRKEAFGRYVIEKRRRTTGQWEYALTGVREPEPTEATLWGEEA